MLFFYAGCTARSNDWLGIDGLPRLSATSRATVRAITVVVSLLVFSLIGMLYANGGGWGFMPTITCEDPSLGRPEPATNFDGRSLAGYPMASLAAVIVPSNAVLGVFCTCVSLALLDFFRLHANFETAFSKWAANTAFGAYLVQAYVIVPLTCACIGVLRNTSPIYFRAGSTKSSTCIDAEGDGAALWLCWIVICLLSVVLSWLVAGVLRKLPGCNRVV